MSSQDSLTSELDRPAKRRIQRRHGACEPCRSSKTKCDGRMPCGACRSERRRQCPCVYSEKAMKLQQVTAEIRRRAESERHGHDNATVSFHDDEDICRTSLNDIRESVTYLSPTHENNELASTRQGLGQVTSEQDTDGMRMSHALSVCTAVEEFKKLKPARGYSGQVVSHCDGFEIAHHVQFSYPFQEPITGPGSSTASHTSPRSEHLNQGLTHTRILGDKLKAVDILVRDGHITQAWRDLGGIIREAQLIEDMTPMKDQSSSTYRTWRQLWNSILDFEAQLGLTLGRPASLIESKPLQAKATNDVLSLEDSTEGIRTDLYQHIQGILGLDLSNTTAVRDFLERAKDVIHHEPFTQIGLCTTDGNSTAVRELHLDTHILFMTVLCRMASICDALSRDLTNGSWSETPAADIIKSLSLHQPRQKLAYCRRMFRSANFVLESFFSLHRSSAEQTGRDWLRCHSVYTAAVILGIAKLRHEVEWHATTEKLRRLEQMFLKMSQAHPSCHLYSTAVKRLRDLSSVEEPASEVARNKHTGIKSRKRSAPEASPGDTNARAVDDISATVTPTTPAKRRIDQCNGSVDEMPSVSGSYARTATQQEEGYHTGSVENQAYEDLNLNHLSLFQDNSAATWSEQSSTFTACSASSSATSYSEADLQLQVVGSDPLNHPGPPFAYPFPIEVLHPPMAWNNGLFVMADQTTTSLPLQMPVMPSYGTEASQMTCPVVSQYGLHTDSNPDTVPSTSHQSGPSQGQSDRALAHTMQIDTASEHTLPSSAGVTISAGGDDGFLHPTKTGLSSQSLPNSRRPSINRTSSTSTIIHSSPSGQDIPPHSSSDWQRTGTISVSQDGRDQLVNNSMSGSNIDRTRNAEVSRRTEPQTLRPLQEPYFGQVMQRSSGLMGHPVFQTAQANFVDTAPTTLGQHHLQSHYSQSHLQPYTRYLVPNSGQFQQQYRRMSIDTGGTPGAPY